MTTKLHHPDSDQTIEVEDEQVPLYETQGWAADAAKAKGSKDTGK